MTRYIRSRLTSPSLESATVSNPNHWTPHGIAMGLVIFFGSWLFQDSLCVINSLHADDLGSFLQTHCVDCHNADTKSGELDLASLKLDAKLPQNYDLWVQIHDRIRDGEMPPADNERLDPVVKAKTLQRISAPLIAFDDAVAASEGRATRRRMNRYEYEYSLRDLFSAPWLQIKEKLPEDGVAYRYNRVAEALDVSHVQIARYMAAAEYAMREVLAEQIEMPKQVTERFYARQCRAFNRKVQYTEFNRSPERATFPILGFEADLPVLEGTAPMTVGNSDPKNRELEALGVVASSYEPIEIKFDSFKAPRSAKYILRFNAFSFWAGPESEEKWWRPSRTDLSKGRTREPISVYAETPPRLLRKLGNFEVNPEPDVYELEVYLLEGETVRPDAVRLFRSRPPGPYRNPLATPEGQPGVAFRWLEVVGPILEQWPSAGHERMFAGLPLKSSKGKVDVVSQSPRADADRLMRLFLKQAYRNDVSEEDVARFLEVVYHALDTKNSFVDAMLTGYAAVLCSPKFIMLDDAPGPLTNQSLATRLSYFLWNGPPDAHLSELAQQSKPWSNDQLREQTLRLLHDGKSQRFVDSFLDYWLDLRKADATSPDSSLYPDYYLDDYLVESAVEETRRFMAELIKHNLPAKNLIDSEFLIINERLARHYAIPDVMGTEFRRVPLPEASCRGGLLTQASLLKVTANGTTTSPVVRGAWMTERILGKSIPPPPAAVPAVEPDTRGAVTIRQQLDKHRSLESCRGCHARIDPPGFALENFDILGGYRQAYRALNETPLDAKAKLKGNDYGKNGQPFEFHDGPAVDPQGQLPDGRTFANLEEMKRLLLQDERQIARNLLQQWIVYGTGAPVRFGDRPELEAILDTCAGDGYRVQDLMIGLVQSDLFRNK